jgi:hypothetical protein
MATANTLQGINTRRSPRYDARLPVLIGTQNKPAKSPIPGLACEISQRGMALYGGIDLQPGDIMDIEFQTPGKLRLTGVVRNRSGFCFGLEFVQQASSGAALAGVLQPVTAPAQIAQEKTWISSHRGDIAIGLATLLMAVALFGAHSANLGESQLSQPSLTLTERALVALGLAELPPPSPADTGNASAQVWVDLHTGLYYCAGADLYGKTPDGKFTTQRDAQLDQFQPAARKTCR